MFFIQLFLLGTVQSMLGANNFKSNSLRDEVGVSSIKLEDNRIVGLLIDDLVSDFCEASDEKSLYTVKFEIVDGLVGVFPGVRNK